VKDGGLEFSSCFLELDAAAKHLDDIRPCDQVVDKVLWNQAAHIRINGFSVRQGLASGFLFWSWPCRAAFL
jgi:hypothetical protein